MKIFFKIFVVCILTSGFSVLNINKASAATTAAVECDVSCRISFSLGGIGWTRVCGTCTTIAFVNPTGGLGCCDTGDDNSGPGPVAEIGLN